MSTQVIRLQYFAYGAIGEALMAIAVLKEAIALNPGLEVNFILRRNAVLILPLCATHPQIQLIDASSYFRLLSVLPRMRKSVLFVQPTFGEHSPLVKAFVHASNLFGARTVGFKDRGHCKLYADTLIFNPEITYIDNVRNAIRSAGFTLEPNGTAPVLEFARQESIKTSGHPYILIHPFAANETRSLPLPRWNQLLKKINAQFPEMEIVITGATANRDAVNVIGKGLLRTEIILGAPLLEVAERIKSAQLYIGVDTGISHLAGVLQKKMILIGNRSNPTWLPTYNPNARILFQEKNCTCDGMKGGNCRVIEDGHSYYRCMYEVTDDEILCAMQEILAAKSRGDPRNQ